MRVTIDIPDLMDEKIIAEAKRDGHENRSAVIRKALTFYFTTKSQKVAKEKKEEASK